MTLATAYTEPTAAAAVLHTLADAHDPLDRTCRFDATGWVRQIGCIELAWSAKQQLLLSTIQYPGRRVFEHQVLEDLRLAREAVLAATHRPRWIVLTADQPSLGAGGDLAFFIEAIEQERWTDLRDYAYRCVEFVHGFQTGFGDSTMTISLAHGQVQGGAFETALAAHVIIAESTAEFSFPEPLFGMFPGMGANVLLAQRIGVIAAERMIMSGNVFKAAQLRDMGVVDVIAEPGEGLDALNRFVRENDRRQAAYLAQTAIRRDLMPASIELFHRIADRWVDVARTLTENDLRRMRRLARKQQQNFDALIEAKNAAKS